MIQFSAEDMRKYLVMGPRNYTLIFFLTSMSEKYPCPACGFVWWWFQTWQKFAVEVAATGVCVAEGTLRDMPHG
jgi:hypothetical protein